VPHIYIGEQVESYSGSVPDSWNKGRLFNALVKELGEDAGGKTVIVLHDADVWEACKGAMPYRLCLDGGAHMLFGYGMMGEWKPVMGGVSCMSLGAYRTVGGFSNSFAGWGWEDIDFGQRLRQHGINVGTKYMAERVNDHDASEHPKLALRRKCVRDVVDGAHGNAHSSRVSWIGTDMPGYAEVNYSLVSRQTLVSDHRGTVTLLRFSLPREEEYAYTGPALPPSTLWSTLPPSSPP
jgi:hypothetical protein